MMGGGQGSGRGSTLAAFDGIDWAQVKQRADGWAEASGSRCRSFAGDPKGRVCLIFTAALAAVALTFATPWLPYSPWNKPASRFVRSPFSVFVVCPGVAFRRRCRWEDSASPQHRATLRVRVTGLPACVQPGCPLALR